MAERRDKLGRRIPEFDRSAAGKKANETRRKKYGADYDKRTGAAGGSHRTRGYFGKLKDTGDEATLKEISHRAAQKSKEVRAEKKASREAESESQPSRERGDEHLSSR